MPADDIVTILLDGLTVAGNQNIYSEGNGFITFVRCKHDNSYLPTDNNDENIDSQEDSNDDVSYSSEAKVAQLYYELVYYPFIEKRRKKIYNMKDDEPIPDNLRVISWMDCANSQIKYITSEENLKKEEEKRLLAANILQ